MPRRGRSTKACQTDPVILSEQDVEKIVIQQISHLNNQVKRLEAELKDLKSNGVKKMSSSEFEKLHTETNQMKTATEKLTKDLDSLNNLQQAVEVSVEELQEQIDTIKEEVSEKFDSISENLEGKHKFNQIHEKIDDLEQQSRLKYLRIFGLEEIEGEDVTESVINFAKDQMQLVINPMEIDATRMGVRRDQMRPRDILVKFENQSLRNIMYQKKRMLRKETQQVFINEHLTTRRSQLFYQVRQMRKQHKVFGTWTQSGNILVKIHEDSTPVAVTNIEAIKSLVHARSSSEFDTDFETTSIEDVL